MAYPCSLGDIKLSEKDQELSLKKTLDEKLIISLFHEIVDTPDKPFIVETDDFDSYCSILNKLDSLNLKFHSEAYTNGIYEIAIPVINWNRKTEGQKSQLEILKDYLLTI